MKKKFSIIIAIITVIILLFCGCQEQNALTIAEESGQLKLKSNVVELYQSSFNINTKPIKDSITGKKNEIVDNIEIKYLFKNIAGRAINIEVYAEFYNKNDTLIGIEGPRSIYLPKDYTEKAFTPQNSIIYDGSRVADVKYAILSVEEKV